MTLQDLLDEKRLRHHKTSAQEIAALFKIVERDLLNANIQHVTADYKFIMAYSAALQLATIALCAAGYRAAGMGHHKTTIQSLPAVMGPQANRRADYLDNCRTKRNITSYDRAGEISDTEASRIIAEVKTFRSDLLAWLKMKHPHLL